jgi:Met-zincin
MKFGADAPIVFALSSSIPERYRDAVRDGVLYWNRALGRPLLQVIDAPANVEAPRADYNVIQWVTSGNYSSTSYIQGDPLTGQILHAHVFVLRETMMDGDLELQNDHLRYIVAHEIGHALGMRHNFAPSRPTTVMDYFNVDGILHIGRDISEGKRALPYDRAVIRHVYLGEPLDVEALPPFCTDGQKDCLPFPSQPSLEPVGIEGNRGFHETVPPD